MEMVECPKKEIWNPSRRGVVIQGRSASKNTMVPSKIKRRSLGSVTCVIVFIYKSRASATLSTVGKKKETPNISSRGNNESHRRTSPGEKSVDSGTEPSISVTRPAVVVSNWDPIGYMILSS